MNNAEVLAAKARGYMQGAQKLEENGDPLAAREYYLKAAEIYLKAYKASDNSQQKTLWKSYTGFLIKKAKTLKLSVHQRPPRQGGQETRRTEAEQLILSEEPNVRFNDVVGLDEVKERIKEAIIYPFTHPEMYQHLNVAPSRGILFYGPPGCGKTLLAKATARESHATFISVKTSDIMDKFVGESEKQIREIFKLAQRKDKAIIFLDEIDAVATSRGQSRQGYERRIVNEILSQMDGVNAQDGQLLVLGATNRPWDIDHALLRAKRFSDTIFIPHPDLKARKALFKLYLRDSPTSKMIAYDELARATVGFEAARIAETCNEAGLIIIRENLAKGSSKQRTVITMKDLRQAVEINKEQLILPSWYSEALRELRDGGQVDQFKGFVRAAQEMLDHFAGDEGII